MQELKKGLPYKITQDEIISFEKTFPLHYQVLLRCIEDKDFIVVDKGLA